MKSIICIVLPCIIFLGCADGNVDNSVADSYVKYSLNVQVVQSGFNGEWCWFHPRAARLANENDVIMLMQLWITSHSDYFQFLSEMLSSNKGQTWSEPESLADSLGENWDEDVMVRICDVTPQWHLKTQKVLATGHTVRYINGKLLQNVMEPIYFFFTPETKKWSSWHVLQMPNLPEFKQSCFGCSQWVECQNGDILIPIYFMRELNTPRYTSTVIRCSFDGNVLRYIEHGDYLDYEKGWGLCEPSLIEFKGDYYLTLRNDSNGFVTKSKDGLHYEKIREWSFNDSTYVYSENTQQHWVKSPRALFLVYTSRREDNKNILRSRAPLFMAQFDEKTMCLIKNTEIILVPNNGAQLGNFGAFDLNEHESWVTTSEGMDKQAVSLGKADGRIYLVKIKWE